MSEFNFVIAYEHGDTLSIVSLLVYKSHFFSDPLIKRLRHNAHQLRPEKANHFVNKEKL